MSNGTGPEKATKPSIFTSNRFKAVLTGCIGVVVVYLAKEIFHLEEETAKQLAQTIIVLITTYIVGRTATDITGPTK